MKKISLLLSLIVITVAGGFFLSPARKVSGQDKTKGWRLWIKDDPCSGRFDWLAVAKTNPTSPGSAKYLPYDHVLPVNPNLNCSLPEPLGCTFEEANAAKEELLSKEEFNQIFRNYL